MWDNYCDFIVSHSFFLYRELKEITKKHIQEAVALIRKVFIQFNKFMYFKDTFKITQIVMIFFNSSSSSLYIFSLCLLINHYHSFNFIPF